MQGNSGQGQHKCRTSVISLALLVQKQRSVLVLSSMKESIKAHIKIIFFKRICLEF